MKKIILVMCTAAIFSCRTDKGIVVTLDDVKSKTVLSAYDDYLNNDTDEWIGTVFSAESKVYSNSLEPITIQENLENIAMHHELFEDISMQFGDSDEKAWVQTVTYPEIGTFSQAWFIWKATGKASGTVIEVPVHIGYEWKDGLIVNTWLHSDQSKLLAEVQFVESMKE